jgi:hypothetical protein
MELHVEAGGWTRLDHLPYAQNVAVAANFDKLLDGSIELRDHRTRSSIGAVDDEKGWRWSLTAAHNEVRFVSNGVGVWKAYPSLEASADAGTPIPMRNASAWLRLAGGWAPGERDQPFANFFFGGFGNNWIDRQDPKRYRQSGAFPGTTIDAVAGTRYGKALGELNLSPIHFEHLGTPGFYASWLRTSVFGGVLAANPDAPAWRRTLGDAGVQCDLRLIVLNQQPFTLSGGYARAFERHQVPTHEWMVSLKVL